MPSRGGVRSSSPRGSHGTAPALTVVDVMALSPDALCAAAWPLLPAAGRQRGLRDVLAERPHFLGDDADPEAAVTAAARVDACAETIHTQLYDTAAGTVRSSDEDPVTCAELRALLLHDVLLRRPSAAPLSPSATRRVAAAGESAVPAAAAASAFLPVTKPDALLAYVGDETMPHEHMVDCVRERIRLPEPSTSSADAAAAASSASPAVPPPFDEGSAALLQTLAELARQAPDAPRAAEVLVAVLRRAVVVAAPSGHECGGYPLTRGGGGGGTGGSLIGHQRIRGAPAATTPVALPPHQQQQQIGSGNPEAVTLFATRVLLPLLYLLPNLRWPAAAPAESAASREGEGDEARAAAHPPAPREARDFRLEVAELLQAAYAPPLSACLRRRPRGTVDGGAGANGVHFTAVHPISLQLRPSSHAAEEAAAVTEQEEEEQEEEEEEEDGGSAEEAPDEEYGDGEEEEGADEEYEDVEEGYEEAEDGPRGAGLGADDDVREQLRDALREMAGFDDEAFLELDGDDDYEGNLVLHMLNSSLNAVGDLHARVRRSGGNASGGDAGARGSLNSVGGYGGNASDAPLPYSTKRFSFPYARRVSIRVRLAENCQNVRFLIVPTDPPLPPQRTSSGAGAGSPGADRAVAAAPVSPSSSADAARLPRCVQPRAGESVEHNGPCDVLVLYNERHGAQPAVLQAEARAEVTLPNFHGSREAEWALCLRRAQRLGAAALIDDLQREEQQEEPCAVATEAANHQAHRRAPGLGALVADSPLFRGGLRELDSAGQSDASSDSHFELQLRANLRRLEGTSDTALRMQTHCRATDVPVVRGLLGLTMRYWLASCLVGGHAAGPSAVPQSASLLQDHPAWKLLARRVGLSSAALSRVPNWAPMMEFLADGLHHPAREFASPAQVADALIAFLLSPHLPGAVDDLRDFLRLRTRTAHRVVQTMNLLRCASDLHSPPLHHTLVVAETRRLMRVISASGHYVANFACCGPAVTRVLRQSYQLLSAHLFSILAGHLRVQLKAASSPPRYLLQPWEYGPFTLLLLSLLATRLDKDDITFIRDNVYTHLILLLPTFDHARRTESFAVHGAAEEQSFANFFSVFFRDPPSSSTVVDASKAAAAAAGGEVGAQENDAADAPPTRPRIPAVLEALFLGGAPRRESSRMTRCHQDQSCPDAFVSRPGVSFAHSTAPVFAYRSNFSSELSVPQDVEVTLQGDGASDGGNDGGLGTLYVGLATSALSLNTPNITKDPNGLYVLGTGELRHGPAASDGERAAALPPLSSGNVLRFTFEFSAAALEWRVCVALDGQRVASIKAPKDSLTLVVGSTEGQNHSIKFKGKITNGTARFTSSPTLYNISLYAGLVFHMLILHCVNEVTTSTGPSSLFSGAASNGFLLPASSSTTSLSATATAAGAGVGAGGANTTTTNNGGNASAALLSFLEHCCIPVTRHIHTLLEGIQSIVEADRANGGGDRHDSDDGTASATNVDLALEVKRGAALQMYNRFLMNFTLDLSSALRATSSTVEMIAALSGIVSTDGVHAAVKCEALSAVCHLVASPSVGRASLGVFDPSYLWRACFTLLLRQQLPVYRPYFTEASVPSGLAVVLESGRRVRCADSLRRSMGLRLIAYSTAGVPLTWGTGEDSSRTLGGGGATSEGDGEAEQVVRVSTRLQRGADSETLGKQHYVGVACVASGSPATTLTAYPGDRAAQPHVYCIADTFDLNERLGATVAAELTRYKDNWLSPERQIIFGSGDVITVELRLRQRMVVFYRNERPLGVICREVPPAVRVLFPFVELNSRDSTAKWLAPPNRLHIHASRAMRALLQRWGTELRPLLLRALHSPDNAESSAALTLCGADGDETCFVYRSPPSPGSPGTVDEVTALHIHGHFALTENKDGALQRAALPALEPNFASPAPSIGVPLAHLYDELATALLAITDADSAPSGTTARSVITTRDSHKCLRLLRLLSEATAAAAADVLAADNDDGSDNSGDDERSSRPHSSLVASSAQRIDFGSPTSRRLVRLALRLVRLDRSALPPAVLLRCAWNEVTCTEYDGDGLLAGTGSVELPCETTTTGATGGGDCSLAEVDLHCPTCGLLWRECADNHPAPVSSCELCHLVLRLRGQPSPYEGWLTSWANADVADTEDDDDDDDDAAEEGEDEEHDAATRASTTHSEASSSAAAAAAATRGSAVGARMAVEVALGGGWAVSSAEEPRITTRERLTFVRDPETGAVTATGNNSRGLVTIQGSFLSPTHFSGYCEMHNYDEAEAEEEVGEEWACEACTLLNPPDSNRCSVCYTPRPGTAWTCQRCRYALNTANEAVCSMCGHMRPGARNRQRGAAREKPTASCVECRTKATYNSYVNLSLRRHCPTCDKVTQWLPKDKYKGTFEAKLCDGGDRIEATWVMDSSVREVAVLSAANFSLGEMAQLAYTAHTAAAATLGSSDATTATTTTDAQLQELCRFYVPPLSPAPASQATLLHDGTGEESSAAAPSGVLRPYGSLFQQSPPEPGVARRGPNSAGGRPCVPAAISYFASQLLLRLAPRCDPGVFASADVLLNLHVPDVAWLAALSRECPSEVLMDVARRCVALLLSDAASTPGAVQSLMRVARVVVLQRDAARPLLPMLLYAACLSAARHPSLPALRAAALELVEHLMYTGSPALEPDARLHSQPVQHLLSRRPIVAGQQAGAIFALLQSLSTGPLMENALVKTMALLARALQCMEAVPPRPLPPLLAQDMAERMPYMVPLSETTLNDAGALLVGQVRGSRGASPTSGGCFYYEVCIPKDFYEDNHVVSVGWGTLQHERISSGHHVGADMYSWGFNCSDKIRIMQEDQPVPVPRRIAPGDVIGTGMDLATMMSFWSLNGELISRVSVPSQGEGELIYPYISASTGQSGLQICFHHTVFCPEGYRHFSLPTDEELWGETPGQEPETAAAVAAQPYAMYRELCGLLEDLQLGEVPAGTLEAVRAAVAESNTKEILQQYPLLSAVIRDTSRPTTTTTTAADPAPAAEERGEGLDAAVAAALLPYVRHLRSLSEMTVMVAHYFAVVRGSDYLSDCYRKARDLLLPQARWVLFETQVGGRPSYVQPSYRVLIDLARARPAGELLPSASAEAPAGELPGTAAEDSAAAGASATGAGLDLDPETLMRRSVTGQLFAQTEHANIFKNAVMFNVQLADSVADDAGGVARSIVSIVGEELNERFINGAHADPLLPLLKLCGHSCVFTVVPNMERLFASMTEDGEESYYYRMFIWLGKLMGNIALCGTLKLPLNFPRMIWKKLTFGTPTLDDYLHDVDDTVRGSLESDEFLLDDASYYAVPGVQQLEAARSSAGGAPAKALHPVPSRVTPAMTPAVSTQNLFAHGHASGAAHGGGGEDAGVGGETGFSAALSRREARRRRAVVEEALLHQFDVAVLAMRRGLTSVIAESTLRTIRPDDLQVRIGGSLGGSVDTLLSSFDTRTLPAQLRENLATVLRRFTDRQRAQFLLFCSGQSRLPLPERVFVSCGDDTSLMPTAHTCSPTSLALQPYETAEELYDKLVVCLAHSQQFGFV